VSAAESAYEQAVRLLARREHSRRELARKLAERDFPEAEREAALDRLEREGLQSDERFAEERERAAAALHKRFGESPPASKKDWARRMRFLEGRGFSPELCRPLVGGVDADES